jgi:hypothetical protein
MGIKKMVKEVVRRELKVSSWRYAVKGKVRN